MYYKDLEVWKVAIEFVKEIYILTGKFPSDEKFGIVSQIRRAAVSIPSNIAEGAVRHSDKESTRFMDIALGSIAELETQLIISKELAFIDDIDEEIKKLKKMSAMLHGLQKFYKKDSHLNVL